MLIVHVPLRFLEPAPLGDALFLLNNLPESLLGLRARESHDHDRDGEDCKQAHERKERQRGEQKPRPLGFGSLAISMPPPKTPPAGHGADIGLRPSPEFPGKGTRDLLLFLHIDLAALRPKALQEADSAKKRAFAKPTRNCAGYLA